MSTLLISDLHLSGERTETRTLFLRFLRERAQGAGALYILGDLFEAWIGDDLILPEYRPVLEAMHSVVACGTPIYLMRGNRDFLLGEVFAQQTGCILLPEPAVIELDSRRALLLHGDTLCTDDRPYQQMRAQLRHPEFISGFLAKPVQERLTFAQQLRTRSQEETRRKQEYSMDVNAEAVASAYRAYSVDLLIHGHTHRRGRHTCSVDEKEVERIVLGDWDREGSVLEICRGQCRLEPFL